METEFNFESYFNSLVSAKKIYMHYDCTKFWEISAVVADLVTISRAGKLYDGFVEQDKSIQTQMRQHENLQTLKEFVKKHIYLKIQKGYQTVDSDYLASINTNGQQDNLKTTNPNSDDKINVGKRTITKFDSDVEPQITKKICKDSEQSQVTQQIEEEKFQVEQDLQFDFVDENFTGEYLEHTQRGTEKFYKIQIKDNWVLEEWCENSEKNVQDEYQHFGTKRECIIYAQKKIYSKLENGYRINHEKFSYDMNIFGDQNFSENNKINSGQEQNKQFQSERQSTSLSTRDSINDQDLKRSASPEIQLGGYVSQQRRGYKAGQAFLNSLRTDNDNTSQNASKTNGNSQQNKENKPQINIFAPQEENYEKNSRKNFSNNDYEKNSDYSNKSKRESLIKSDGQNQSDFQQPRQRTRNQTNSGQIFQSNDNNWNNQRVTNGRSSDLGPPTSGAISVLLAEKWDEIKDPTGWFMSEKLDGVRCYWNGKTLYSRNKNIFHAPKFFTEGWPNSPLDGELFTGRDTFQTCVSYVRKNKPIDEEWEKVQFVVFDAPNCNLPFQKRIKKIEEVIQQINSPYLIAHEHEVCKDSDHLMEALRRAEAQGGEGMMLRDPNSYYENRRSKSLLKVKTFHDDEAKVIGHDRGEGRCAGMIGSLRVQNAQGVIFNVGSGLNDKQRQNPPKIGSYITYKYQSLSKNGVPRFPTFLRVAPTKL